MNTIKIIYQERPGKTNFPQKVITLAINLMGATLITWVFILLVYEIPCTIGKMVDVNCHIIEAAVKADKKITMKYRTQSLSINKLIHELEEMKAFYSQI